MAQIFVVEHNLEVRNLLIVALKRAGHQVNDTNNILHCITLAQETQPDVIMLDLELDGFNMLRQLRLHSWTQNVPVIGMTTQLQINTREQIQVKGFVAILEKPFLIDVMLECIAKSMQNQIQLNDSATSQFHYS